MRLPGEKKIHTPEGGWDEASWYVVDIAFNANNFIHQALFYSGFLSDGKPAGYNQLIHHSYTSVHTITDAYYLKPIRRLSKVGTHTNMNVVEDLMIKASGLVLLLDVIKKDLPAEITEAMELVMGACDAYRIGDNDED